jgi:hypothetical protein
MSTPPPPTPGMPTGTPEPTPKKPKTAVWVGVAVVIALLVGSSLTSNGDDSGPPNNTNGGGAVTADMVASALLAKAGAEAQFGNGVATLGYDRAESEFRKGYGDPANAPSAEAVFAAMEAHC